MATGMRSTPTHLPSQHYVVASSEGLYVLCCHFYPLWKHIYTHTHTTFISTCLHWHMAGSYLAQLLHYPYLHPAPRPPLSRITPAVKVIALPASLLCCIKASLCFFYSAYCFLIICLHHTMHFYSTGRLSYLYQSCPQGTSPCSDLSMMEPSVKSTYCMSLNSEKVTIILPLVQPELLYTIEYTLGWGKSIKRTN